MLAGFEITVLLGAEAEAICVEATAPVRTRVTTKARTIIFMGVLLKLYFVVKISLYIGDEVTIR